jgi:DNA-nicking Smr family endonuclease
MPKISPKRPKKVIPDREDSPAGHYLEPFLEPVVLPITGVLDLHTFSPREVAPLLEDYLEACQEQGLTHLKIIHGKGTGQLKARVRHLLAQNPAVAHLADAAADGGGWGATLVTLKPGPTMKA